MEEEPSTSDSATRPPLNLTREAYGYLVIAAGVALALVVLWNFPEEMQYRRTLRLLVAFAVAAVTGYVYQYVTNTWYEQFE